MSIANVRQVLSSPSWDATFSTWYVEVEYIKTQEVIAVGKMACGDYNSACAVSAGHSFEVPDEEKE